MLQCCLNGYRDKSFHPAAPTSLPEIIAEARRAIAAGAVELHVHPRDEAGLETLDPGVTAATARAVRSEFPGIPFGFSTAWSIAPGGMDRLQSIADWTEGPDYVSANFVEPGVEPLLAAISGAGIGIEAGLSNVHDAERFVAWPGANGCVRAMIEVEEQEVADALATAEVMLAVLTAAKITCPVLVHGFDAPIWALHDFAVSRGLQRRIGLEDGRLLPDGRVARDNAELVSTAIARGGS